MVKRVTNHFNRIRSGGPKRAVETLVASGIPKVAANKVATGVGPFWAQLDVEEYYGPIGGGQVDRSELFRDPTNFESNFMAYAKHAHLYIAGHYYDSRAPSYLPERTQSKRNLQLSMSQI